MDNVHIFVLVKYVLIHLIIAYEHRKENRYFNDDTSNRPSRTHPYIMTFSRAHMYIYLTGVCLYSIPLSHRIPSIKAFPLNAPYSHTPTSITRLNLALHLVLILASVSPILRLLPYPSLLYP